MCKQPFPAEAQNQSASSPSSKHSWSFKKSLFLKIPFGAALFQAVVSTFSGALISTRPTFHSVLLSPPHPECLPCPGSSATNLTTDKQVVGQVSFGLHGGRAHAEYKTCVIVSIQELQDASK